MAILASLPAEAAYKFARMLRQLRAFHTVFLLFSVATRHLKVNLHKTDQFCAAHRNIENRTVLAKIIAFCDYLAGVKRN